MTHTRHLVIGVSIVNFLFQILKISTMMTICHDAEIFELKLKHVIGFCVGHYIILTGKGEIET